MISPLNEVKLFDIKNYVDDRGSISFIEDHEVGFPIKRVYFFDSKSKNVVRGKHAHIKLKQLFICLSGSCTVVLKDGLGQQKKILLKDDNRAIIIPPLLWREITDFSENFVFFVLASESYSKDDYIHDYDNFKVFVENLKC